MEATDRRTGEHARNEGFSLVELMVALVILTIGLLPLAFVQTRANQDVVDSGRYSEALAIGQLQMEEAKSLGFGAIPADTGQVDNFTWIRDVQNMGQGLDQVTVSVTWNERGAPRTVRFINQVSFR